jgi:hypothetical protein
MHCRSHGNAKIDAPALYRHGEVAILHGVLLTGVDLTQNLHNAEDAFEDCHAEVNRLEHVAIHTQAHGSGIDARLHVNVSRPGAECGKEHQAKRANAFARFIIAPAVQTSAFRLVQRHALAVNQTYIFFIEGLVGRRVDDFAQLALITGLCICDFGIEIDIKGRLLQQRVGFLRHFEIRRDLSILPTHLLLGIDEPQFRGSDLDHIAVVQKLHCDFLVVEARAVAGAQIAHAKTAIHGLNHAMMPAGLLVGHNQRIVGQAPDSDRVQAQFKSFLSLRRFHFQIWH